MIFEDSVDKFDELYNTIREGNKTPACWSLNAERISSIIESVREIILWNFLYQLLYTKITK